MERKHLGRRCVLALTAAGMLVMSPGLAAREGVSHPTLAGVSPLADTVLDRLRGGFALPNGTELRIGLEFRTTVNGETIVQSLSESELLGSQGVVHRITTNPNPDGGEILELGGTALYEDTLQDHRVSVELSDNVRGLMNIIQTDIDQTSIQRDIILNLDVPTSPAALRAGSLMLRMQGAASLGL